MGKRHEARGTRRGAVGKRHWATANSVGSKVQVIASYRDLRVWQEAMTLAEDAYRIAVILPKGRGGLSDQIWRSALSVPANIAEGYGRGSSRSYVQFLKIARGSLYELETEVLLAQRVRLLDGSQTAPLLSRAESISKMLNAMIKSIRMHQTST